MKNIFQKGLPAGRQGFTLIELFIVIAIIGVLVAVVLLAIDPLEQINRGRDAGRKNSVAQLGHAMQAYATAQTSTGMYPGIGKLAAGVALSATNWQTWLGPTGAGELKNVIDNTSASLLCTTGTSVQAGYCYNSCGSTECPDMVVWALLVSKSEKSRAQCTATQVPAAVYSGAQGKAGTGCLNTATELPAPGILLQ